MDFDTMDVDNAANMAIITPAPENPVKPNPGHLLMDIWYIIFDQLLDEEAIPALQALALVSKHLHKGILNHVPFVCPSRKPHARICRAAKPPRLPTRPNVEVCKFMARPENVSEQDFPFRLNLLYCSGCECRHPARAFSQTERRKTAGLICIGREGYVRLCEHETLTWAQVEKAVRKRRRECPSSSWKKYWIPRQCTECQSRYHYFRFGPPSIDLKEMRRPRHWIASLLWDSHLCIGDRRVYSMARDLRGIDKTSDQQKGSVPRHFCDGANSPTPCRGTSPPHHIRHVKRIDVGKPQPLPPAKTGKPFQERFRLNPTHEWFHAVDPRSYDHEDLRHLCKDPTCYYYRYEYQVYCPYRRPYWRRQKPREEAPLYALNFPIKDENDQHVVEDQDDWHGSLYWDDSRVTNQTQTETQTESMERNLSRNNYEGLCED